MEQLIAGAKFPAKCVKNEIHNLLTTLRLTRHKSSHGPQAQFHYEALRSFQRLFEELTYIYELHEFDTIAYLKPFLDVIQSDATDGQITAVALASVDKFVSFGLIKPDSPRCMEAVNTLAWGVINCRFVSSGNANDEVVLLKMVCLLIDCLRCPAGDYLSDMCVWHMVRKCFQISRQPRASHLLRSSAEGVLQQMILTIFGTHKERGRRICIKAAADSSGTGTAPARAVADAAPLSPPPQNAVIERSSSSSPAPLQVYRPYGYRAMHFVLRFLAFLLAYGRSGSSGAAGEAKKTKKVVRRPRSQSPSGHRSPSTRSPRDRSLSPSSEPSNDLGLTDTSSGDKKDLCADMHVLGLSLLNVALESGGDEIARSDELICLVQDDICMTLLQNSQTDSLSVLSLTLRSIFNLFLHFKRHLKVQLEVFFTSVHLKIARDGAASYEQRELALESILEFCREPELMLELYENYDCDVRCSNLFESLVKFLVSHAFPTDAVARGGGFNSLHRLSLSGLLSILHSIALRCGDRKFRGEEVLTVGAGNTSPVARSTAAETELQRKKEQKRRFTLAARAFNNAPKKCMGALQSLGLVSDPPTPESVAEFLRHTPGLDLPLVGEYLSNRAEFNGQVRKAFMMLFGFQGMHVVDALRLCLGTFRLPGESQLIERLMESFAESYYVSQVPCVDTADGQKPSENSDPLKLPRIIPCGAQGEDAVDGAGDSGDAGGGPAEAARGGVSRVRMTSSDTIFVLSYSIIMLNTDQHNPGVKTRMKETDFFRNNRGIDDGKDLPEYFLREVFETIRDEEIRLHGDKAEGGETVVDDFFWEGILKRSESIDEFSTTERLLSEALPGATERDMFQVIMDCAPLPTLSLCYESVPDVSVALQAMSGFQDLAKISFYFGQGDAVNSLVRVMCQYFAKASSSGVLAVRAQIALRAGGQCVAQHAPLFREAEWRTVLDVLLQLWALDLLPPHLTEFDDFTGPDGKPLESLCKLEPPYKAPPQPASVGVEAPFSPEQAPSPAGISDMPSLQMPDPNRQSDGFLESLTRWFDDEIRDGEDDSEGAEHRRSNLMDVDMEMLPVLPGASEPFTDDGLPELPVNSRNPAVVHTQVKKYVAHSGFVELLTLASLSRLPPESLQILAKGLVVLSRPRKWSTGVAPVQAAMPASGGAVPSSGERRDSGDGSPTVGEELSLLGPGEGETAGEEWHEVADPIFGLELLTNMTCMPLSAGQSVSQIWPLVSTHFERLLQFVIAGGGSTEQQFIERLIVNTVRLCIRLIGNDELVATLLSLLQHLSKLPPSFFAPYSERIACGLLVFVKQTNLTNSGVSVIFSLLKRISEFQDSEFAGIAGIEILNYWLNDDQELSRLLSQQQFPEMLAALKAFALQNNTPASATALDHLSNLVPQLARRTRSLPQSVAGRWQDLWVPTLSALSHVALAGPQKSSAQAFVFLQRLLLERGTELSLPWEELPFSAWKECLEQVLFPLLQAQTSADSGKVPCPDTVASRQANAAQLLCRVVLTHLPDWQQTSPDTFPALFLRLLHVLVCEASSASSLACEPLVQSLKNLLLVISTDPTFSQLSSPQHGTSLQEATWSVVSPLLPELRREIALILDPSLADEEAVGAAPAAV